jgi:uncharacterized YigZ family protein
VNIIKSVLNSENTIIIKNSKFICLLYNINSKDEILKHLENVKNIYPNATHYCYAYILDNERHESDDGEPAGTAGIPMFQVLEKNDLNHVLCIVVRYFGKIKLGAGGLVRAYTKSVVECLKNNIITLNKGFEINITFNYNNLKQIDYLLKNSIIKNKFFDKEITYNLIISEDTLNILKQLNDINIEIINNTYY